MDDESPPKPGSRKTSKENEARQDLSGIIKTESPIKSNRPSTADQPPPVKKKINGNQSSSSTLGTYSNGSLSSTESLGIRIPQKPLKHDFSPKPYSFKMPSVCSVGMKNARVQCPPFHILLDHTIAVIWLLYSPKEPSRELGIVHLQWAISFLQAIRNHNGDNPDDVSMCLRAMQERVVELYSDMNSFVTSPTAAKSNNIVKSNNTNTEPTMTVEIYDSFKKSLDQLKTEQDKQCRTRSMTCTESRYPISITLVEMLRHHPEFLEDVFKNVSEIGALVCPECKTPCLPKNALTGITSTSSVSRTQMLGVLKNWRQEQVERIQEELKRLHSIEEFMFSLNKDNEDLIDNKVVEQIYAYEQKKDAEAKKPPD